MSGPAPGREGGYVPVRPASVGAREAVLLAAVLVAALLLRLWGFGNVSLDHYDEGAYGLSAIGVLDPAGSHLFPAQYKFAPPVYFTLAAMLRRGFGIAAPDALVLLNVVLGTLTVAAVWWAGRRWFGPAVGVGAAVLLAGNEYHIGLSRSGLTDVAFALSFIAALLALVAVLQRGTIRAAVVAGFAVGLAWNTKYHGWFAGVVAGGALIGWALQHRPPRPRLARPVGLLLVAGVVAAALYLPWAAYIQSQPGGYRAFAEYQSTMLHGGWFENLVRQLEFQRFLEGPWTRAAPLAALAAMLVLRGGTPRRVPVLVPLAMGAMVLLGGGTLLVTLLGLAALPWLVRAVRTYEAWCVAVWVGLWVVMTPFYRPYARLVLPLVMALALAGVWGLVSMLVRFRPGGVTRWTVGSTGVAMTAVAVLLVAWWLPGSGSPWRPSPTLRTAVHDMLAHVPAGSRVVVFGEPAASVYFEEAGRPSFERIENPEQLDTVSAPTYVVTGRYARAVPVTREGMAAFADRLDSLGSFPLIPKDIRILDDMRPRAARALLRPEAAGTTAPVDTAYRLELFVLHPRPTTGPGGGPS